MRRFEKSFAWLAAALVIAATTLFLSCDSGSKTARGSASGGNEEYKVLHIDTTEAQPLEAALNENAKQGWKVRTGMGTSLIVLAR